MYESSGNVASPKAHAPVEASCCEATRGKRSRRRRRVDHRVSGCDGTAGAGPRRSARAGVGTCGMKSAGRKGARSPLERAEEEQRAPCRGKASWAGENFVLSRERGRSSLGGSGRVGTRAPRKMRAPASARVATGASEARSHGVVTQGKTWGQENPGKAQQAITARARSAEAIGCVVKRTISGLGGRQPAGCTREEDSRKMSRKQTGYGCSLQSCREAETDRTHL